jgi:hypothetical protein
MKFRLYEKTISLETAAPTTSEWIDIGGLGADSFSVVSPVVVSTPTAKTFDSGVAEVDTATFQAKADTDPGDYLVIYDTTGEAWAIAADITGSDPEPTGAVWAAIPAAQKAQVDLSGASTAATVATAFQNAFNALTSVPFTANDSTADCAFTQALNGVINAPEVHNADDSGDGSISVVVTTAGTASEVDVTANTVTITSHGMLTGLKGQLTTTGTLPGGLSTSTDYFVIYVDANTIKFASSLVNAQAGTAINITNQGTSGAVNTFTATSLATASWKLQQANDKNNPIDLGTATNITTSATLSLEKDRPLYRYVRVWVTLAAGQLTMPLQILAKGDRDA